MQEIAMHFDFRLEEFSDRDMLADWVGMMESVRSRRILYATNIIETLNSLGVTSGRQFTIFQSLYGQMINTSIP